MNFSIYTFSFSQLLIYCIEYKESITYFILFLCLFLNIHWDFQQKNDRLIANVTSHLMNDYLSIVPFPITRVISRSSGNINELLTSCNDNPVQFIYEK